MKRNQVQASLRGRRSRMLQEEVGYDTYKSKGKLKDPTACLRCGAVFYRGRWSWSAQPTQVYDAVCPACHRIADHCPAGVVHLSGPFFEAHKEEILNKVRREEAAEKTEHPLSRIMWMEASGMETNITTTDSHLPRRIGEALRSAYDGEIHLRYEEDGFARVSWKR